MDRTASEEGVNSEELAVETLRKQLQLRRVRELRKQTVPRARAMGYVTDEDVLSRRLVRIVFDTNIFIAVVIAPSGCVL